MRFEKAKAIGYWVTTTLIALDFIMSGVTSLTRSPMVLESMRHLGYPSYFALILGVWKLLGGIALLVPRFPRLKEWAYAGIFFDVTSAAISHAASGDGAGIVLMPLTFMVIAAISWALRPQSRTLRVVARTETQNIRLGELETA